MDDDTDDSWLNENYEENIDDWFLDENSSADGTTMIESSNDEED